MVDTDFLNVYSHTVADLPKLNAVDVADAIMYALETPNHVQVEDITLQAKRRYDTAGNLWECVGWCERAAKAGKHLQKSTHTLTHSLHIHVRHPCYVLKTMNETYKNAVLNWFLWKNQTSNIYYAHKVVVVVVLFKEYITLLLHFDFWFVNIS